MDISDPWGIGVPAQGGVSYALVPHADKRKDLLGDFTNYSPRDLLWLSESGKYKKKGPLPARRVSAAAGEDRQALCQYSTWD